MATLRNIKNELEKEYGKSAWRRGVIGYAWELFDNIEERLNYLGLCYDDNVSLEMLNTAMLNGASDWKEYSWGGSSFIYDSDIAKVLCTPSELKKTDNGRRRPNKQEEWLDVQARALWQAAHLITSIAWSLDRKGAQA
jgi:hypothetical protein